MFHLLALESVIRNKLSVQQNIAVTTVRARADKWSQKLYQNGVKCGTRGIQKPMAAFP